MNLTINRIMRVGRRNSGVIFKWYAFISLALQFCLPGPFGLVIAMLLVLICVYSWEAVRYGIRKASHVDLTLYSDPVVTEFFDRHHIDASPGI